MKAISINNLNFKYNGSSGYAIKVDELNIDEGETVLITGKSGSGKSTLLNCINGIIPHIINGVLEGEVYVYGKLVKETPLRILSTLVGTVLQDPETQIINYTVLEEIAFGPENLGFPKEIIDINVKNAMKLTNIEHLSNRDVNTLSGGEMQRTAIASVLSMNPKLLILDEPTSNLDPQGTDEFLSVFRNLYRNGKTLIIAEHKLERLLPFVNRIIVLDKGEISLDFSSNSLLDKVKELEDFGLEIPENYKIAYNYKLENPDIYYVKNFIKANKIILNYPSRKLNKNAILDFDVKVQDEQGNYLVNANASIKEKEIIAIMGKNGAGKTTLLKAISGLLSGERLKVHGKVFINGKDVMAMPLWKRGNYIFYMPQAFEIMLINRTVENEISFSYKIKGEKNYKEKVKELMRMFDLERYSNSDPLLLSYGQKRRVVMASALSTGAKVIAMDEPTSGQDYYNRIVMGNEIRSLSENKDITFLIVTHDSKFSYLFADKIMLIDKGKIVAFDTPEEVFRISSDYGIKPPSDFYLRCETC